MELIKQLLDFLSYSVVLLLVFRLVVNATLPLMDKTEARYAEIARLMVETNNWIVLQIDYDIPFWAKPPLSTWFTALSFKMFGVNEFTARLPFFLLSLLMALLLGKYAKRQRLSFWLPALILFTLPEFFLHAGVVSTDVTLTVSIVLIMLSFWEVVSGNKTWYWRYVFFIGFGLGFLAKGPIVILLTMPPIVVWLWIHKLFKKVWLLFPWFIGMAIVFGIALPWNVMAENHSPGFIDYFIVGEHFKRFFDSTWTGDKYGFPKSQPFGMIWVFALLFALPWFQIVILKLFKHKTKVLKNKWTSFLLLWLIWTHLFFTTSKSLIHPYIMPIMVPIALLIIYWWTEIKYRKIIVRMVLILSIVVSAVYGYALTTNTIKLYANSDKFFVEGKKGRELFHFAKKSYSGQFYSNGKLKSIQLEELERIIDDKKPFDLIIKKRDLELIPKKVFKNLKEIDSNHKKILYKSVIKNPLAIN